MKSIVDKKHTSEPGYPRLETYTDCDLVILMTDSTSGTVVHVGNDEMYRHGHYSVNWDSTHREIFHGIIKLSNE